MTGNFYFFSYRFSGNEKGYTLIELLIAMQLTMLVISLAVWGFGFATKVMSRWQKSTTSQIEQLQLERALQITLNRIHGIEQAEDNRLLGRSDDGSGIEIKLIDSSLIINSSHIRGVHKLSFRYYLYQNREIKVFQQVPAGWLPSIKAIKIELTIDSDKAKTIQIFRRIKWGAVILRNDNSSYFDFIRKIVFYRNVRGGERVV
ncbi:MAG: type II secretion system protein [Calditrichota bacterium]